LVIYDYASHWKTSYNYFDTQADIDDFRAAHQPCQNILVEFNTFVVGPTQFSSSLYHNDNPTANHPPVLINNAVHSGFWIYDDRIEQHVWIPHDDQEFNFPSKQYLIQNCLLWSPSLNIIDTYHSHEGLQTVLNHDIFWSPKEPFVPYIGQSKVVGQITNMIFADPELVLPEYDYWDLQSTLPLNYSNYHVQRRFWDSFSTKFYPYSALADQEGIGRQLSDPVFASEAKTLYGSEDTRRVDMAPTGSLRF
jgi:hypothetical protein